MEQERIMPASGSNDMWMETGSSAKAEENILAMTKRVTELRMLGTFLRDRIYSKIRRWMCDVNDTDVATRECKILWWYMFFRLTDKW